MAKAQKAKQKAKKQKLSRLALLNETEAALADEIEQREQEHRNALTLLNEQLELVKELRPTAENLARLCDRYEDTEHGTFLRERIMEILNDALSMGAF